MEVIMKINIKNVFLFIVGICALTLFIEHIIMFTPHDYFFNANPDINYYVGINVVSAIADFSFFTYHTIILFGLWCVGYSISDCFKLVKFNKFIRHKSVITFIFTNFLITTVLYTIFELTSGNITFGLYALNGKAIHNFGTNILGHYLFFIIILIVFIKIKPSGNIKNKHMLFMSCYILIYYFYVLISGKFMYQIEWYPYPIFDTYALFGVRLSPSIEIPVLIIISLVLSAGYFFLLKGISYIKFKIK
jgi:hypothetical protein